MKHKTAASTRKPITAITRDHGDHGDSPITGSPDHRITRSLSHRPSLVVYVTCGDPDLATTRSIVLSAVRAGADVIELGVPFSDPVADGPVIQRASERALRGGTSLQDVLRLAREIRRESEAGLVVFSYLNPVLRLGLDRFADEAAQAGVDGALLIDLTVEEADEYRPLMSARHLDTIFLAAPTSPDQRLKKIAQACTGFVYAVSRTGVTGTQNQLATEARGLVGRIRKFTKLPVAVGFGVSGPEQFAQIGEFADAAAVGSAIVRAIEQNPGREPEAVADLVRSLRDGASQTATSRR
jgi:tryptophan synthase alpha chain